MKSFLNFYLKQKRIASGLSISELSWLSEISRHVIGKAEKGQRHLPKGREKLEKYLKLLKIPEHEYQFFLDLNRGHIPHEILMLPEGVGFFNNIFQLILSGDLNNEKLKKINQVVFNSMV